MAVYKYDNTQYITTDSDYRKEKRGGVRKRQKIYSVIQVQRQKSTIIITVLKIALTCNSGSRDSHNYDKGSNYDNNSINNNNNNNNNHTVKIDIVNQLKKRIY